MKMRKKLAALLAAAMIASVMPMTAFAASTNTVTYAVKVAKDTILVNTTPVAGEARAPELKIELKDDLSTGQAFFITLANAEWKDDLVEDPSNSRVVGDEPGKTLTVEKTGGKTATVTGHVSAGNTIYIPLLTVLKGGEATVTVDGEGSVVDSSETVFAVAPDSGIASEIVVDDAAGFAETGKVAEITIKEPFQGAYGSSDKTSLEFTLELRDSDFAFVKVDEEGTPGATGYVAGTRVDGKRGLADFEMTSPNTNLRLEDNNTTLKIVMTPAQLAATQRGDLVISGLGITRVSRNAAKGEVKAVIRGDFVDSSQTVVIAKHTDFTTKLEMAKEYTVETGKEVDVEFTLSEELSKSLARNRSITFGLSKGAKFKTSLKNSFDADGHRITDQDLGIRVKAKKDTTVDHQTESKFDAEKNDAYNAFELIEVQPVASEKASYTFKATILVPNNFEGDEVILTAEGRALSDNHEVVAAKVTRPVSVTIEPMDVKVGLKQQIGGKIVIKENAKESILRNYKDANGRTIGSTTYPATIDIRIGDDYGWNTDGLRITGADIEVTEGDLVLDLDAKVFDGGYISIPVKRQSTEASTIEITNVIVDANRMVPEGKYSVKVGGNALSKNTSLYEFLSDKGLKTDIFYDNDGVASYFFDPIAMVDFINITTKNTEDGGSTKGAEVVSFVIGNNKFIVDGVEVEMDAAPYIKDGRTMVPVRYLAAALGIDGAAVKFNAGVVTLFAADGKVIQVSVGSKNLVVNGMTIPMVAAAEIVEGRTYVPVTEIGVVFGVSGSWDPATQTATFSKN